MLGNPSRLQAYQPLADLRLTFNHEGEPRDYMRALDLDRAYGTNTMQTQRQATCRGFVAGVDYG